MLNLEGFILISLYLERTVGLLIKLLKILLYFTAALESITNFECTYYYWDALSLSTLFLSVWFVAVVFRVGSDEFLVFYLTGPSFIIE